MTTKDLLKKYTEGRSLVQVEVEITNIYLTVLSYHELIMIQSRLGRKDILTKDDKIKLRELRYLTTGTNLSSRDGKYYITIEEYHG
jgi:hypothetical protein